MQWTDNFTRKTIIWNDELETNLDDRHRKSSSKHSATASQHARDLSQSFEKSKVCLHTPENNNIDE